MRLNNPDALPFLVDEALGRIDGRRQEAASHRRPDDLRWRNPLRRTRLGDAAGRRAGAWTASLELKDARFGPERPGEKAVALSSIVADFRFLPLELRFIVDDFAAKGPTFDVGLNAEIAPDGPGVSLKLDIKIDPSVTQDVMRLWPQFINPDVRDWCSHNLHGGQIEGAMAANWSAADLDAMDHKRAVSRDSVHGTFSTREVGVDLLPGLPMMISGTGSGTFTGRDFTVAGDHATMALTPTRRIEADTSSSSSRTPRRARSSTPRRAPT